MPSIGARQAAGRAFVERVMLRQSDREPLTGQAAMMAQLGAFRKWDGNKTAPFAALRQISQPSLVPNGVRDMLIPVRNSCLLAEHLPHAVLIRWVEAQCTSTSNFSHGPIVSRFAIKACFPPFSAVT
jgi:hypothetical protein